jgi:hypothetical protein
MILCWRILICTDSTENSRIRSANKTFYAHHGLDFKIKKFIAGFKPGNRSPFDSLKTFWLKFGHPTSNRDGHF